MSPSTPTPALSLEPSELRGLQARTVGVLSVATILGGLGVGAALSVGALLLAEVSGNDAISGLASTMYSAGTAVAGIPLARLSARRGRRFSLVTGSTAAMVGVLVAISGTVIDQWSVLAVGIGLMGVGSAVQLLSRFSATDLALPEKRARDLSLVVWSITVGAVVGPNLMGPGAAIGALLGLTPLAGVFVFTFFAQALAALVNWFGLRPDPLLTAQRLAAQRRADQRFAVRSEAGADRPEASVPTGSGSADAARSGDADASAAGRRAAALTILVIAMAQAIMVGLMAMTPLHLMHHDGTPEIVGITLSLHIAGMYALSPVFGMLTSRFGGIPVIVLGWGLFLVAIVIAYFSGPSHLLVQIAMTLVGLGWSGVTVAGAALLTDVVAESERPRWQGRSDTFMSSAGAIAGALSGVIFALGDFSLLALLTGVLLALGAVASLRLPRARSRRLAAASSRETSLQ